MLVVLDELSEDVELSDEEEELSDEESDEDPLSLPDRLSVL